jgi:hypothetical protein
LKGVQKNHARTRLAHGLNRVHYDNETNDRRAVEPRGKKEKMALRCTISLGDA